MVQLAGYHAPVSHTRPSPHSPQQVSYYSFPVLLRTGSWAGMSTVSLQLAQGRSDLHLKVYYNNS